MLRLTRPSLRIPLLTLLFLLLLGGVAEAVARLPAFQSRLMAPTLNTRHRQFEMQWWRLQQVAEEDGRIDCIILGSSMVVSGFNPLVFAHTYQEETGEALHCFNFGIDAIPTMTAGALAQILMEEYQPRLLIYGMDARDLAVTRTDRDTTVILDMPWLQYRLGRFNLEGWLVEHSALYRYRRLLFNLSRFYYRDTLRSYYGSETPHGRLGYDPDDTVADYIAMPPDPNNPEYQIQYYFRVLSAYQVQAENQAGLEMLLVQQQASSQLLVVEMPVPDTYFYFFGEATADYAAFTHYVDETTAHYDVPFWETTSLHLIPDDGWMDYSHLNTNGATIFSAWLGRQVGQAVNNGELARGERGQ
ncbi:MAG: hypothetical protein IAE79_14200 [Anaerolinea sp.]|nr:hypothetical protein [Anaerolinea sp.]